MGYLKTTGSAMAILFFAGQAAAAHNCSQPTPPAIPEGSTATMEEMVEAQERVKSYQDAMGGYRTCLERHMESVKAAMQAGDSSVSPDYMGTNAEFNLSVSKEEKVAEDFNLAIRAYKSVNPSE